MQILLASGNPHKREEVTAIWQQRAQEHPEASHIELIGLDTLDQSIPEPEEDGQTFEANAELKARYYALATGRVCIADDSGLEVDALGGEPGVRSARYSGVVGPRDQVDTGNNALLIEKLLDIPAAKRTARFVCAMALCSPAKPSGPPRILAVVRGTIEGVIIGPGEQPRGENGFGYDPLFYVPDLGKTTAELAPEEKNRISHRGNAARLMWDQVTHLLQSGAIS